MTSGLPNRWRSDAMRALNHWSATGAPDIANAATYVRCDLQAIRMNGADGRAFLLDGAKEIMNKVTGQDQAVQRFTRN